MSLMPTKQKRPKRLRVRFLRQQNTLLRDLQNLRQTLKQSGVAKKHTPKRPGAKFGDQTIIDTLQNVHAKIDIAILMVRRGKLAYPAYFLGIASAAANAINDEEYILAAAARIDLEREGKLL